MGATTPQAAATLTESDNGTTVDLRIGETVALRLHENASSGYRWVFDAQEARLVGVREGPFLRRSGAVGSGGDMQWILEAKAAGEARVSFKLIRQWEGDASCRNQFVVTLRVRP